MWAAAWVLIAVPHVLAAAGDRVTEHVQRYAVVEGTMALHFDSDALSALGFSFVPIGDIDTDSDHSSILFEIDAASPTTVDIADGVFERFGGGKLSACGALLIDRPGERIVIGNLAMGASDGGVLRLESTLDPRHADQSVFELTSALVELDRAAGRLRLEGELAISESWADELQIPGGAGTVVGAVLIDAKMTPQRVAINKCAVAGGGGESEGMLTTAGVEGSDVIVADLQSTISYPVSGDVASFGIATLACNLGTQRASWVSYTNQHPVIVQNLFRLKSNRFEQIGMAWVKHGFYAVSDNFCMTCMDPTDGTALGVGCSDPYSASLNVVQSNMSPRYLINAHTGYFAYPWAGPGWIGQERRLLVRKSDLDPAQNTGARYFMEGHYVHPDDSRANTQDNNASYREVVVGNPSSGYYTLVINPGWATQRGQPAVRAWRDSDPDVVETDIRVPGEGLFILAARASDTGTGVWRYSYALQNLNSDRSARTFSIQLPSGVVITNVGFHDIAYHSGEPIAHDPWAVTITDDSITWSTTTYGVNPNANALRYDTVYNFYFNANREPSVNKSTIGLFKPGAPSEVAAATIGPKLDFDDCNRNGFCDACDLDCGATSCLCSPPPICGQSLDCNGNSVPDECEDDCNLNGIADECDITACPQGDLACADCNDNLIPDGCEADCDGNGIPDACDELHDCDGDGVTDCFDLCRCTTPVGACVPPAIVCCHYQSGFDIPNYPRYACIAQGGTPLCSVSEPGSCDGVPCPESLCLNGCLIGDLDRDGDLDGDDFAIFLAAFGHRLSDPEYNPDADMDDDGTITLVDYQLWLQVYRGFIDNSSATAPIPGALGDLDVDGDIDLADFADLQSCINGASEMSLLCIVKFDFDGNQRVDLDDFPAFQSVFEGPQR